MANHRYFAGRDFSGSGSPDFSSGVTAASQQKGPAGAGPLNNALEPEMPSLGGFFLDD
jgi:hypothetical protein